MNTKTAASFIASMMGAGLLAGALAAGPAQASVTVASPPAVQTATTATGFLTGCGGCWRRRCCCRCQRCCRCGGGCGWGGDWGGDWW
ncbi:hypothetical protein FHR32_002378 [Streptosporangium album]|uniref:Uncharacterized protein n=1 Tax=Streptosporangium album TaxID=47479 RepID=A0A7W7RTT0_9ACTN|nr:hypothetical protein [Streptosporangium album]MBB4938073.1 hypothetical protein [Streptosporangium album]